MLFKGEDCSLNLDIVSYELPEGEGDPTSDDRNWLVLRAKWINEEGEITIDSNSCLLTYELREMAAGLKVLCAGVKDSYASDFVEPYFEVAAQTEEEDAIRVAVSFFLPNTMDGEDTAEVECVMTREELKALVDEMDRLCEKFPDRA